MTDTITIRTNDFAYVYKMAVKAQSNHEQTELGRLGRIRGMAILQALYELGLVDGENQPVDPTWLGASTAPAQ